MAQPRQTTPESSRSLDRHTQVRLNPPSDDYVLYQLSSRNKYALLKDAIGNKEESDEEGRRILENLAFFDKSVADCFQLRSDAVFEAPLRLLFSADAKIVQDEISECESYIILSYCWHGTNSDWKKATSELNLVPWSFSQRLVEDPDAGILSWRTSKDEGIWLDAVCIDQDSSEKHAAIGAMNFIYASARQLIIILEDVLLEEEEARFIYEWKQHMRSYEEHVKTWSQIKHWADHEPGAQRLSVSVYNKISASRWFNRAWCHHEIRCSPTFVAPARQPQLLVPSRSGKPVAIPVSAYYLMHELTCARPNSAIAPVMDALLSKFQRQVLKRLQPHPYYQPIVSILRNDFNQPLFAEIDRVLAKGASIFHDKLQIALNLAGVPLVWLNQENNVSEDGLYWICILLSLGTGDKSVLGFWGGQLTYPKLDSQELGRSWARRSGPFGFYSHTAQACSDVQELGISAVEMEYIELDLLVLEPPLIDAEVVKELSLLGNTIVTAHNLDYCLSPNDDAIPRLDEAGIDKVNLLVGYLALAGPAWIRNAWSCLQQNYLIPEMIVEGGWPHQMFSTGFYSGPDATTGTPLHKTAGLLLSLCEVSDADKPQYFPFVVSFLAAIMDEAFRIIFCITSPKLILTGDYSPMNLAIIPSFDTAYLTDVVVAVPASLAGRECPHRRAWLLQRRPDGAWRSRGTDYLLGCDTIVEGGRVKLQKGVRVYGT
ncbi:hypothetical protein QBC41DRAFT_55492 [Cercophora samala]|uniref:Heterokaryon incompatibility domain-containing protein n=1 Tax=Cercophora samala TaxID=330535 RepID=A0AA39YTW1_9PEZI|nr:hypothetical protein QBC41DRAFT_55492 [Cercophora samala]